MSTLPVLLKDPRILLIGGGRVALHKATVLKENQIHFELLANSFENAFQALDMQQVTRLKDIAASDIDAFNIIIDATGNPNVKALLKRAKAERFLLLNIVDDPTSSDFYFTSLLNYGRLKIAVSTDGASPTLGQTVRDQIKKVIPAEIAAFVEEKATERAQQKINVEATRAGTLRRLTQVDLVGCGPGDVNLLTLQAFQCIGEAEVVLYDHLITQEILDLIPNQAEKIYVGKKKQVHGLRQEEINELILEQASHGLRVARLKSGDPYVFGRGAEEAQFLACHGVRVRVIPGLSSAVAAPSAAGIPLTSRGYATNVSIVSAHLSGSRLNTDWFPLLQIPKHTTVVLMGLSFAKEISMLALRKGVSANMPVAIVSNATRSNQETIITSIEKMAESACQAKRPAILIFGDVVKLSSILPHKLLDGDGGC
jgi:uroporphyrin-III C-methyltransferase/precorrin-2 dehydrogenase/sirohydrochlorin ferrochelatase